jgi:hypothetical protein
MEFAALLIVIAPTECKRAAALQPRSGARMQPTA